MNSSYPLHNPVPELPVTPAAAAIDRGRAAAFALPGLPPGRRYRPFALYLRQTYGGRLQKISLDAGFSCPNRDGTLGRGGCSFCSNDAFVPSYARATTPLAEQIAAGIRFHAHRYRRSIGFLAYFQAYSNTYAEPARLDELFRTATAHPQVRGLIVGTRPDCLPSPILDVLEDWSHRTELFVEIGIESTSDAVLAAVNRCHDFACSAAAIRACAARGLRTGGHLIAGLPGESPAEFIASAATLSALPLHSLKIHQLQIFRNTPLAKQAITNPTLLQPVKLTDYLDQVIDFLERLRPDIWIERIGGEAPPAQVISQTWGLRNDALLRAFEERLEQRQTYQGCRFRVPAASGPHR